MPQSAAKASPALSSSLAEHFADREGLTGTGRAQFLKYIEDSLGANHPTHPGKWQTLLFISVGVGLVGLAVDLSTTVGPVLPGVLLWSSFSGLGVVLSLILRRVEQRSGPVDREIHWRAYCLLLRPVVLVEKPGLLDRNLTEDQSKHEQIALTPYWSFRHMLRERGADFWWSGGIGVLTATLALIVWHRIAPRPLAISEMALPVSGVFVGPAIWALILNTAYWLARRQSRQLRE